MVQFNKKTSQDTNAGKIRLGDDDAAKTDNKTATDKKWVKPAAIAGGVAAIGLAGYFILASHGTDVPAKPVNPPISVTTPPPATTSPVIVPPKQPQLPSASAIRAQGVQEKRSSIYTDHVNYEADAFIKSNHSEGNTGADFSTHVGVFKQGGASVLITEGPYAGTRVGFFPSVANGEGRLTVSIEKVGAVVPVTSQSGPVAQFTALPHVEEHDIVLHADTERQRADKNGFHPPAAVAVPDSAPAFEKQKRIDGEWYKAFVLSGSPEKDGVFSVELWNGDTYAMDLKTGAFTVNSIFLFEPNYEAIVDQKCANVPLDQPCVVFKRGESFPSVVNGTVAPIAPAPAKINAPQP